MSRHPNWGRLGWLLGTTSVVVLCLTAPAIAQTAISETQDPPADGDVIVVTGSRLQDDSFIAPTPVATIGAEELEELAKPTLGEMLQEMPSFRSANGLGQGQRGTIFAGQATLDLRGLGAARTLTLVDGQRVVPTTGSGAFDTNMLPTGMIQRVDVVTGGASAAYGADAVAGVVNFIINRELEGFRGDFRYGVSQEGDAAEYGINVAYGGSLFDDRLHVVAGADFSKGDGTGNAYTRDWGRDEIDIVQLGANRPAGTPALVIAPNAHYSIAPGSLITSCLSGATVVANCSLGGLTFNNDGTPRPFQFGSQVGAVTMAGGENYGFNASRNSLLKQAYERAAGLVTFTYDAADNLTFNVDLSAGQFQVFSRSIDYAAPANFIRINRDNPFVPAALAAQMDAQGITQVRMSRLNTDVGGIKPFNESQYYRIAAGVEGEVFDDWSWSADVSTGDSEFTYQASNFMVLPNYYSALHAVAGPGGSVVCGSLATNPMAALLTPLQQAVIQPGCVPYNPFGPDRNSQAVLDYVSDTSSRTENFARTSASINLAGSPLELPAGEVSVAVGYEYHKDEYSQTVPSSTEAIAAASGFFATNFREGEGELDVHEFYGEVGVPVLSDVPAFHTLDLNAAVRYADYSSTGEATTWKAGLTWEPIDWLRFRATRSKDIRAPNIPELFVPGLEGFANGVVNPATGVSGNSRTQAGNNPGLEPEEADTTTVGLVFQPQDGPFSTLRVSLDYFDIEIQKSIASLSINEVLRRFFVLNDQSFAPFIELDSSPLGFSKVQAPLFNLNSEQTSGVDVSASYTLDLEDYNLPGSLNLVSNATYTQDLESFSAAGVSLGQRAGESSGTPEWRANFNVTYELDRFSATLSARYNSEIKYRFDLRDPSDAGYNPASPLSISDNYYPAMTYFSLGASYDVTDQFEVYGVVDNLFDRDPPAGAFWILQANNPYDPVGRYFRVGLRTQF